MVGDQAERPANVGLTIVSGTMPSLTRRFNVRIPLRDGITLSADLTLPGGAARARGGEQDTVRQGGRAAVQPRDRVRHGRLRRRLRGRARARRLRRAVPALPQRRPGRLRRHRLGGRAGLVHRGRGHPRRQLRRPGSSGSPRWSTRRRCARWFAWSPPATRSSRRRRASPRRCTSTGSGWWTPRMPQYVENVNWTEVYRHRPLMTMDEAAGFVSPNWRAELAHRTLDEWWEPVRYQHRIGEVDVPVLHVSGWYDDEEIGTPANFAAMVAAGRDRQRLLMGPWGHAVNTHPHARRGGLRPERAHRPRRGRRRVSRRAREGDQARAGRRPGADLRDGGGRMAG